MTLPPQWVATELGSLVTFVRGVTYKKEQVRDSSAPGYVPILRAGNLQDGRIVWEDLVYVPTECVSDGQRVRAGDIIVAMSSGSASVVGKAAAVTLADGTHGAAFGAFCGVWRPTASAVAAWTAAFFQSAEYRSAASAAAAGVNINNLRADHITGMRIALPPANEQQRITAKLSELGARSRRAKESLDAVPPLLDKLRQSILAAAFRGDLTVDWRTKNPNVEPADKLLARVRAERRTHHDRAEAAQGRSRLYREATDFDPSMATAPLPEGWAWVPADQCAWDITVGHVGPMKHRYTPEGVPFLRSQNVRENRFDPAGLLFIPADFHAELENSSLRPGDLVVVRSGAPGTACVIPPTLPAANCSDIVICRLVPSVLPRLLCHFVNSQHAKTQVLDAQVGVAQQHFNIGAMRKLAVPLMPVSEQNELLARIDIAFGAIARLEAALSEASTRCATLDASLLAKAFRGELAPQDPVDEPATNLLAIARTARGESAAASRPRSKRISRRRTAPAPVEPPAQPPLRVAPLPALDTDSLVAHAGSALWPHGPLDKDVAVRRLADHLRDTGLVSFQRLRADGPLYAQLADAIDAAVKAGHLDRPKRGQVRTCKPDATAYTADDWRHALLAVLGPSPTDRDDAIRAAAEWARDNCGLEFTRLRADGHIVTGLRSALNSAIRRDEVVRHGADQIARTTEPLPKGQLSFADLSPTGRGEPP